MLAAPPGLEILETRQEGPTVVIYGARQMPLGRAVELVSLAPGVLSSSPLARSLEHEAAVLAKLDHPNILRLYDLKRDDAQLWLILEDVDGPRLTELSKLEMSWQAAAAICLDLARALSHAHAVGETHGRLRLSAVRLTKSGRTKLFGFGQGQHAEIDEAETLEPASPGGLSPEGSVGQTVGPLSDLFAWGSVLYELLAGQPPFGEPRDSQYPARIRNTSHKPLISLRSDVPPALERLIDQCLEKQPSLRPTSARAVAAQLEDLIGSSTLPLLQEELQRLNLGTLAFLERDQKQPASQEPGHSNFSSRMGFFALLSTFVLGGALMTAFFTLRDGDSDSPRSQVSSEALPTENSLLLRVNATPWAHVIVDGQHRETTPFARPIALSPGKHVVRLEHPYAPPEERIVEGKKGQAVLINVQLHVKKPLVLEAPTETAPEASP